MSTPNLPAPTDSMASGGRRHQREHLAYLAARILAEDGTRDFSSAKRKAARQAGIVGRMDLPDDQEVEQALRSWQTLYQSGTQKDHLKGLREQALDLMDWLAPFDPWLTGPVLTGTAGPHSPIKLLVFTDEDKALALHFLDHGRDSGQEVKRVHYGDRYLDVPVLRFVDRDVQVTVQVLPRDVLRMARTGGGKAASRARSKDVRALLQVGSVSAF